jgi:D-2-hydroxyacid dehydrogenase (NADP+)
MTPPPIKLLLSIHALLTWGSQITAAVPAGSLTFVTAEEAISAGGACDADIAFMTREVTGASSKGNPSPQLRDFEILLRGAPKLRWLQIHPAGAERPLYAELRARGVRVTTASGATAVTVAHSTLGAVIALNRRFPHLADAQRRHAWEQRIGANAPRDLKGQCAVIVGLGPIGRHIADLLNVLGLRTIGVRRTPLPEPPCDLTVSYDQLGQVLPQADWLILCCPASPQTRGIANAAAFAAMPQGSHLINVARGEVAVERDVIAALANGHLAGAYLDVFEREPLDATSPLWEMPNVIVSPHTASHSLGQPQAILEIFLDNLRRWHAGEKLRNDIADLV